MTGPAGRGVFGALAEALEAAPGDGERPNLWRDLAVRVDPAEFRPRLHPGVEVKTFRLRWGNDYAMVSSPDRDMHYRLEPWEAEILELMDGTRTVKEIVVERFRESGDMELAGLADLVEQLRAGNFLDVRYVDVPKALRGAIQPVTGARALARQFAKTLSLEWQGAHRLVAWFYRNGLKWFFNPVALTLGILASLGGFAAFVAVYRTGRFSLSAGDAAAASLILLAMNYVLTFVHELAHAVVLVHHGRRVKSAGFMIYFGSPAFFVDSSDGLMMERGQRIMQAFGGPFAELVIAGAASFAAWTAPDAWAAPILYKFALLNYFVIFLNLVPMLELDGYFVLSDLIQVPDLRPRSLQFIRYDLWSKLRRRERFTKQETGLALYGILGVAFTIFALSTSVYFWEEVFGSLVRRLWDGGPVSRILLIALALFVAGPVLRGGIALLRSLLRRARAVAQAVRFRLQTRWRVEAARMVDALPIFEDLPEDVLSDLAGRVQLRSFAAGRPVFRQGDRPDAFYVVRRGTLHVVEEDPETGQERVLRTLGPGESFGELGLVDGRPRTATVRPVEDCQLFVVGEGTFDRLLSGMVHVPEFAPTLQEVAELRGLPAFAALEASDLAEVLARGAWVNVAPGETVIEQGEEGDAFYAIGSGQMEVSIDGRPAGTLGPGTHFGEIALLMDVPRTATVIARTPARLFRLDREGFDRVIAGAFRRGTLDPAAAVDRTWQH